MKSIVISVLMLSTSLLFVSCENEGQLTQSASDVETQILDKKPHDGDLIIFEGELTGEETVMGCCPNAGPSPVYPELELSGPNLPVGIYYNGEIFMNSTGRQSPGDYMVQYYVELVTGGTIYLEIRGGVAHKDKRTKVLTVIFTYEDTLCEIWIDGDSLTTVPVDFTLIRDPLRYNH